MENHSVEEQRRISHVSSCKQTGETPSAFTTCATCGRTCKRTYCSVSCYRVAQRSQPTADRFWAKVRTAGPDACWLWTASTWNSGYGQFRVSVDGHQVTYGAHRYAWELANGPVSDGLHVLHRCDTKRCCNVRHLFLGTHTDNMRDAAAKSRLSVPRPTARKVTDAQIAEMVSMRRSGLSLVQIAAHFDVSKGFVSLVVRGLRRADAVAQMEGAA